MTNHTPDQLKFMQSIAQQILLTQIDPNTLCLGLLIARDAAIADIESEAAAVRLEGDLHWDIRPMLDSNLNSPDLLHLNERAIAFALAVGVAEPHTEHRHMLKIIRKIASTPLPAAQAQEERDLEVSP